MYRQKYKQKLTQFKVVTKPGKIIDLLWSHDFVKNKLHALWFIYIYIYIYKYISGSRHWLLAGRNNSKQSYQNLPPNHCSNQNFHCAVLIFYELIWDWKCTKKGSEKPDWPYTTGWLRQKSVELLQSLLKALKAVCLILSNFNFFILSYMITNISIFKYLHFKYLFAIKQLI